MNEKVRQESDARVTAEKKGKLYENGRKIFDFSWDQHFLSYIMDIFSLLDLMLSKTYAKVNMIFSFLGALV